MRLHLVPGSRAGAPGRAPKPTGHMEKFTRIPEPTIQRLPLYYRCLSEFKEGDREIISSEDIASKIPGMKASQFRKDLSYFGEFGVQGMGYVVTHLLDRISSI